MKTSTAGDSDAESHPVCVVLHGLEVGLLAVLYVPYPDDGVPSGGVEAAEERVVLQGVDPGAVTPLAFVADHKRHLGGQRGN